MLRTSGRHTVGRVMAAWPGWVRVEVERGGANKEVPEGQVHRLLGAIRLEDSDAAATLPGLCAPPPAAARPNASHGGGSGGHGHDGHGGGERTVALGQQAGGLPAEAGLTHSDFRAGEPVGPACVPRTPCHAPLATTAPTLVSVRPRQSRPLPPPLPPSCPQVAVLRSSGRHTVGQVAATRPGWVQVLVEPGMTKEVPEGDVYRLLGGLRLA